MMRPISRRAMMGGLGASAMALGTGFYLLRPHQPIELESHDEIHGPLRMAWADGRYEPMLALCKNGLFAQHGLHLTVMPTENDNRSIDLLGPPDPVDIVVAPLLDWIPAFYRPNVAPPPAKLVCSIRTGYYRVVVQRNRRINKMADLRGKTIGITSFHGADRRFLSIRLRRKFMHPTSDVTWVELPASEMAQAFIDGKIDAFVLHDDAAWRVLKAVGKRGWNMLDSMTGLARNRVDLVLGIADTALQKYPQLAKRLSSCFLAAQHAYKGQIDGLIKDWSARPDTPPDLAGMLRRQTGGGVMTNDLLRVQVAQYVDEFKLIKQIPGTTHAAEIAAALIYTV